MIDQTSTRRRAVAPLALLLVGLALGGCGSSGSDTTTTTAAAGNRTGGDPAQREKLQACLKQQGVDLPQRPAGAGGPGAPPGGAPPTGDGGSPSGDGAPSTGDGGPPAGLPGGGGVPGAGAGGPGGLSSDQRRKLQAAMQKCGVDPSRFGRRAGGGARPDDAAYRKRVTAYVACVRENGFDLPDPDFSGKGPIFDPEKVDQQDATFQKASRACQAKLRPAAPANG